jgi:alpha-ribazole phosphatase/probable phosphoglycerate mutase
MTDLLFIRHAETDMAGTFCGQSDPPVNVAGRRQISELLASLWKETIAAVYTSDLQRSVTTARALAELFSVPCIVRPALRENHFGEWEGLTWEQIEELYPTEATQWLDGFPHMTPPRAEAFTDFQERVVAEARYLLSRNEHGLIAVVCHAGVMRVVLRALCGVDERTAWTLTMPYCCTYRYAQQDRRLQEVLG